MCLYKPRSSPWATPKKDEGMGGNVLGSYGRHSVIFLFAQFHSNEIFKFCLQSVFCRLKSNIQRFLYWRINPEVLMFRHTVLTSNLVIYYIWRPSGALGCIILKLTEIWR